VGKLLEWCERIERENRLYLVDAGIWIVDEHACLLQWRGYGSVLFRGRLSQNHARGCTRDAGPVLIGKCK
jgi:hypothetical protein